MYSREATAKLGLKVSVSATVRTGVEMKLYDLACQHAAAAQAACKSGNHEEELSSSIQAIILAAACMEAFINQEAISVLGPHDFDKYDSGHIDAHCKLLSEKRGYPSLEDKWCEITERISNKTFDKGKQPFQGFHELVELRNKVLHYKGISAQPVLSPWQGVERSVTPERGKLTAELAQNVVNSIRGMLQEYHIFCGKQLPQWVK
jgi:hypothetical protein